MARADRFVTLSDRSKSLELQRLIYGQEYQELDHLLTELEAKGNGSLKNVLFTRANFIPEANLLMLAFQQIGRSENNENAEREAFRETIRVLLKHHVDVNYQIKDGDSVLHRLFKTQESYFGFDQVDLVDPVVLQLLLDAGADVNLQNNRGQTPLSVIFQQSEPSTPQQREKLKDITNRILQMGWNPLLDEGENSPLAIAKAKGLTSIVDILETYYEQHTPNRNTSTTYGGGRRRRHKTRRAHHAHRILGRKAHKKSHRARRNKTC